MDLIDIIIPVYNERENILQVLSAIQNNVRSPIRILICYDSEDDNTLVALKDFHTDRFEILAIRNQGVGALGAILTGFKRSDTRACITYFADDDYNAGILDAMIEKFNQGCDLVCPSRYIPGGKIEGNPWLKAILGRLVAFTLRHFARLPVHDPTNAFRLFSRRLLDAVTIESTAGFTYSLELLVKCHRLGWRIEELPALWFERKHGTSRFRVFAWAPQYLRWYFYAYQTTYLTGITDKV
jgi:dolichol-phosphate mannosyltransferase